MKVHSTRANAPAGRGNPLPSWARSAGMAGASAQAHYELLRTQHRLRAREGLPRALRAPVLLGVLRAVVIVAVIVATAPPSSGPAAFTPAGWAVAGVLLAYLAVTSARPARLRTAVALVVLAFVVDPTVNGVGWVVAVAAVVCLRHTPRRGWARAELWCAVMVWLAPATTNLRGAPVLALLAVVLVTGPVVRRVRVVRAVPDEVDRWRRDAVGERATAVAVQGLVDTGWPVCHDRSIPGSAANVDHLLVGPGGLFHLDAKMWGGPLRWDGEQLWNGHHPTGREVATARWETDKVIAALSPVLPDGWVVPVRTVLVVHGSPMPLGAVTAYADGDPTRPVSIVSAAIVSAWLDTDAAVFTAPQRQLLGMLVDQALPAYTPQPLTPLRRPRRGWTRRREMRVQRPWARRHHRPS